MPPADVRWHQPTFRQSIRTRLLVLFLGLIVISVLAICYLGVNSVQTAGESAHRISTQALRTQAEEYLRRVTVGDTQRHDLILREVQHNAENLAQYASSIFAQPEAFASVFHALWWSVATLTTVGYGDVYPVTAGGKVFTAAILAIGLGIVAVPAGILATALAEARSLEETRPEQPRKLTG